MSAEPMNPPSDGELWVLLEAIVAQQGGETFERPEEFEPERSMEIINELLSRGWVTASATNTGDDRLMSVRGLRPTALGDHALEDLRRAAISTEERGSISITEKKRRRALLMADLYGLSDGLQLNVVSPDELAQRLGWTRNEADNVLEYLEKEGLVELTGYGPQVGITHAGVVEVEYALEHPGQSTEHFLPHSVVVVQGGMYGGQIQAGTIASNQEQHLELSHRLDDVGEFARAIREALSEGLQLSDDDRAVVESELRTVEAQLSSPKPNLGALREALRSLRAITEGVAATGVFVGLVELARHLPI
jgi:hypothetical protein